MVKFLQYEVLAVYEKSTRCNMLRNPCMMSLGNFWNSHKKQIVLQVIKTELTGLTFMSGCRVVHFKVHFFHFQHLLSATGLHMDSDVESNVRHLSTHCSTALTATCTTWCTDTHKLHVP